jgi:SlyX protein
MNDIATFAARIEALETRIAHQDRAIDDLNGIITAQWKEIDGLKRQSARLGDQLQEVQARVPEGPEPPPPHY